MISTNRSTSLWLFTVAIGVTLAVATPLQQAGVSEQDSRPVDPRLDELKLEVGVDIEARRDFTQQMVDSIFSFGELGFQEYETQRYVTEILEQNGFRVERGVAGIPTAWMATWGEGSPVIALGTDIDGIPQASQKPGVAYRDPIVAGAPGHGEGHNSGQALVVTAALAVKKVMERDGIAGTLKLWPGVAEEQLGTKAHFVRAGLFDDVDAVLYCHVGTGLSTGWGVRNGSSGMVSVEFLFEGEAAHGAGSPWDGRSALDAVELMNVGWNYRREHLRLQQRSHYVISDGGDQPNVVPPSASVWYYFRETTYPRIKEMLSIGERMAEAAAMMTDTTMTSQVLGVAWPLHMNRALAEAMHSNIQRVGMPVWSEADQRLATAVQAMLGVETGGLETEVSRELRGQERIPEGEERGGYSDDIGDISWAVPTATLSFPSNIPGGAGHNWNKAIAMATPIAHKGATAGAKVHAMTVLDLLLTPSLTENAWAYYRDVQTQDQQYISLLRPEDEPAIWLNKELMERYRPQMREFYYDPSRYDTYLEQLGIEYPTVR
jgi:aminobenzoyl-glutamate utilization protein B